MNIKEVATFLKWPPANVKLAIEQGVELPRSKNVVVLKATGDAAHFDVSDEDLDDFLSQFEKEEPGRHPPVEVRRTLRVEANHKCGICRNDLPLQFHHIFEWEHLKHHDPTFMIAICGGCHDKIGVGIIEKHEQLKYKDKLRAGIADISVDTEAHFQSLFSTAAFWPELTSLLSSLEKNGNVIESGNEASEDYKYYVEPAVKNELNKLGEAYFRLISEEDEPHFASIQAFLGEPANQEAADVYYALVVDWRRRVASLQDAGVPFEWVLIRLTDKARQELGAMSGQSYLMLRTLVSFMYVSCDIGKKHVA